MWFSFAWNEPTFVLVVGIFVFLRWVFESRWYKPFVEKTLPAWVNFVIKRLVSPFVAFGISAYTTFAVTRWMWMRHKEMGLHDMVVYAATSSWSKLAVFGSWLYHETDLVASELYGASSTILVGVVSLVLIEVFSAYLYRKLKRTYRFFRYKYVLWLRSEARIEREQRKEKARQELIELDALRRLQRSCEKGQLRAKEA